MKEKNEDLRKLDKILETQNMETMEQYQQGTIRRHTLEKTVRYI